MNPGSPKKMTIKEEPVDQEFSGDHETTNTIGFEIIKKESFYSRLSPPPLRWFAQNETEIPNQETPVGNTEHVARVGLNSITSENVDIKEEPIDREESRIAIINKEENTRNQQKNEKLEILQSAHEDQKVEIDLSTSRNVTIKDEKIDQEIIPVEAAHSDERSNVGQFEIIQTHQICSNPSFSPFQYVIQGGTLIPKQSEPIAQYSTFGTQKPAIIPLKTIDSRSCYDEPIDCNRREICYAEPWVVLNRSNKPSQNPPYRREPFKCSVCSRTFSTSVKLYAHVKDRDDKKQHECGICLETFGQKTTLKRHMLTLHTAEKPQECAVCREFFARKSQLHAHMLTHCGEKPYECTVCGKRFAGKHRLGKHVMWIHSGGLQYVCGICRRTYEHKAALKIHMIDHTSKTVIKRTSDPEKVFPRTLVSGKTVLIHPGERLYECASCGAVFRNSPAIQRHMLLHMEEKSRECCVCRRLFGTNVQLKKHMMLHTREKSRNCCICQKAFAKNVDLRRHMIGHTGNKSHECVVCRASFAKVFELQKHMMTHTGEKVLFECCNCRGTFRSSLELREHMQTHFGERLFECDVCRRSFPRKATLRKHVAVHFAERRHECVVCGRKFTRRINLMTHMITHSEKSTCCCDVCGKRFVRKDSLHRHMLIHTGERPYECTVCNKTFQQKTVMRHHMLIHTGEKPHECKICKKTFRRNSDLQQHIKIHSVARFECIFCPKMFRHETSLRRHMPIHTRNLPFRSDTFDDGFLMKQSMNVHSEEKQKVDHKKHMLLHSEESSFQCSVCEKTFERKSNLKKHILLHSEESPFQGGVCDETFERKVELKQHMLLHSSYYMDMQYLLGAIRDSR